VGIIAGAMAPVGLFAAPAGEAEHMTGGKPVVARPEIDSVKCSAGCGTHGRVVSGGKVRLKGTNLGATRKVLFLGRSGSGDDVAVHVKPTSDTKLEVTVPYSAVSGPLAAWASNTVESDPSKSVTIVPAPAPKQTGKLERTTGPSDPGAPTVNTAVGSGTAYVAGRRVTFSYRLGNTAAVVVKVVRLSDGATLRTWSRDNVGAGAVRKLSWNTKDHGSQAPDDRYAFRLVATAASGAATHNAADDDETRDAFDLHAFTFPLRGHHSYGDPFGVPRPGHTHQGQDVIASCGTQIVAARGGRVKASSYQAAAGNYVVIDGAGTGYDFLYAHLREASKHKVGDHVYTGQQIGRVGETGDAVGCHLHFEMWTPPGWYTGGHPFDPAPFLKAWDRYS
jgi:murein DD-endopeptidase MepM/ murein hydrolase activator NlpD